MSTKGIKKAAQEHLFNSAISRTVLKESGGGGYLIMSWIIHMEEQAHQQTHK